MTPDTDPTLVERYRRARGDSTLVVVEGFHALKHGLRFGAEVLEARAPDPDHVLGLAERLAPDLVDRLGALLMGVAGSEFEALAPSPHPTGVIALARRPRAGVADLLAGPAPVVLLDRPTHHGNIGAVIRVAAAAGAAGVAVTGPHDPWHPSSVRGAAGLQFALPVASLEPAGVDEVIASDRPVVALDPAGDPLPGPGAAGPAGSQGRAPFPARAVLVFGSERSGVSRALLDRADRRLAIPMRPGVSSLNLATAVAVTLFATGAWTRGPGPE